MLDGGVGGDHLLERGDGGVEARCDGHAALHGAASEDGGAACGDFGCGEPEGEGVDGGAVAACDGGERGVGKREFVEDPGGDVGRGIEGTGGGVFLRLGGGVRGRDWGGDWAGFGGFGVSSGNRTGAIRASAIGALQHAIDDAVVGDVGAVGVCVR